MLPNSPVSIVQALKDKLWSTEGFTAISCQPHLMLGSVEREIHLPFPTYFTLQSLSATPTFSGVKPWSMSWTTGSSTVLPPQGRPSKLVSHTPNTRAPQSCLLQVLQGQEYQSGLRVKKKIEMVSQRKINTFMWLYPWWHPLGSPSCNSKPARWSWAQHVPVANLLNEKQHALKLCPTKILSGCFHTRTGMSSDRDSKPH